MNKIILVCIIGLIAIMFGIELKFKIGRFKFKWLGITYLNNFINKLKTSLSKTHK